MTQPKTFDEWFEAKHGYTFDYLASTMQITGAMQFLSAALRDYVTQMVAAEMPARHEWLIYKVRPPNVMRPLDAQEARPDLLDTSTPAGV